MNRKRRILALLIFTLMCFSGCGVNKQDSKNDNGQVQTISHDVVQSDSEASGDKYVIPDSYMITTQNYFDYQGINECSGYAGAYILRSLGADIDGKTLYDRIEGKNDDGTVWPDPLVNAIQNEGYDAYYYLDSSLEDVKEWISKGVPVIVLIKVDKNDTMLHYIPVVGYDEYYFYFADSLSYKTNEIADYYNRKETYEEFETLWDTQEAHNFVIIIKKRNA